jgi:hypothetical protein
LKKMATNEEILQQLLEYQEEVIRRQDLLVLSNLATS